MEILLWPYLLLSALTVLFGVVLRSAASWKGALGSQTCSLGSAAHTKKRPMVIIGASFSGLSLARKALARGLRVVILEKRHTASGVWSARDGLANVDSRLQSEHIIYRECGDDMAYTTLYPGRQEVEDGLASRAQCLMEAGVEIKYGCYVTQVTDVGNAGVRVSYMQSQAIKKLEKEMVEEAVVEIFASVHVRTGSLSYPQQQASVPGLEEHFAGRWCEGVRSGLEAMTVKGKHVLVVGMGAFGIENAKRAIDLGASRVTLLTRSANGVCPRYLIHHGATSFLNLRNMFLQTELDQRWAELFVQLRRCPRTTAFDLNDNLFSHRGHDHFKFNSSSQSDWFYAALAMGALDILHGELSAAVSPEAVEIKLRMKGDGGNAGLGTQRLQADVVVLCMGQACDTTLLKGLALTSVMFGMEGKLTHNLKADYYKSPTIFGPRTAVPLFPVLSYGVVGDFVDTLALCNLLDPGFYARWRQASAGGLHADLQYIEEIDGPKWIGLFWSAFVCGIPAVGCELIGLMYARYEAYCVQEGREGGGWYKAVKADWDKDVKALQQWRAVYRSQEAEIEALPYPWTAPPALQPQRRSKRCYQGLYYLASLVGVVRVLQLLNRLPLLHPLLKAVL